MKSIWKWLKESHRWQHLLIGLLIGLGANGWYCAAYAGIGVSVTSELKDKMWGWHLGLDRLYSYHRRFSNRLRDSWTYFRNLIRT